MELQYNDSDLPIDGNAVQGNDNGPSHGERSEGCSIYCIGVTRSKLFGTWSAEYSVLFEHICSLIGHLTTVLTRVFPLILFTLLACQGGTVEERAHCTL